MAATAARIQPYLSGLLTKAAPPVIAARRRGALFRDLILFHFPFRNRQRRNENFAPNAEFGTRNLKVERQVTRN
jgi:hypothetical protein